MTKQIDDAPIYVFAQRPRCPSCSSPALKTIRSIKTDDTQRRTTICRKCGERFYVVIE